MAAPSQQCVLIQYTRDWELPSRTAACIQVEAYLRLAEISFSVEAVESAGNSPNGQLPALEDGKDIVGCDVARSGDSGFDSARRIIAHLRDKRRDIDATLTTSQRGEALAFTTLLRTALEPAVVWTTWCEWTSFQQHTRAVYGRSFPWPLNYMLPWSQRRSVMARCTDHDGDKVYGDAVAAIAAFAARLQDTVASDGGVHYFFGKRPSSLDAQLFAILLYLRSSPTSAPVLRQAVEASAVLVAYINRMMTEHFAAEAPPYVPPSIDASAAWSSAARGESQRNKDSSSERDMRMSKQAKWWLGGVGAATAAYVLFSQRYFAIELYEQDAEDALDDDDDE